MLYRIAALAILPLAFALAPAAAEEPSGPDLAVGECSPWLAGYRYCRGGADWFVIEVLEERVSLAAIASD